MKNLASRLYQSHKVRAFVIMLISSLGFTTGLFLVRFLGEKEHVGDVLDFQSTAALLSFMLQLGYRASLRKYYYEGYLKIVKVSEDFFYLFVLVAASLFMVIEWFFGVQYYVVASFAIAFLTYTQTQAVVRGKIMAQLYSAIGNFAVCSSAGVLYIVLNDYDLFLIEVLSYSFILIYFRKVDLYRLVRRKRIILNVIARSQSYQVGSLVIVAMIYVLTQSVILKYDGGEEIVAFADVQLISGFSALVLGQGLLLFERKIYSDLDKKTRIYTVFSACHLIFALLLASGLSLIHEVPFILNFAFLYILNSRVVLGYLVQYGDSQRVYLDMAFLVLVVWYVIYYYFLLDLSVLVQTVPVICLILFGIYIMKQPKGISA